MPSRLTANAADVNVINTLRDGDDENLDNFPPNDEGARVFATLPELQLLGPVDEQINTPALRSMTRQQMAETLQHSNITNVVGMALQRLKSGEQGDILLYDV